MATNNLGYVLGKNPIAQSFYVYETDGIVLTKIKLYFAERHSTADPNRTPNVSIQIRPMRNGFPSNYEVMPNSSVFLPPSSVAVSADATVATEFEFAEPLFLQGLKEYALVVYSDSPDYRIYVSEVDKVIIGSNTLKVSKQPTLGSLFYSQNGSTFTPNQAQDLKFEMYRAKFKSTSGSIRLNNATLPKRKLNVRNPITTIAGSPNVTVTAPMHGFVINDQVNITGALTVGGLSTAVLNGLHTVTAVDWKSFTVSVGTNATTSARGGGLNVFTTKNIVMNTLYPNLQYLLPENTSFANITFKGVTHQTLGGLETPYTQEALFSRISVNKNINTLTAPHVVMADSIEDIEIGIGTKSAQLEIGLTSTSDNVSPIIDLQRASITTIANIIDNQDSASYNAINFANEYQPSGGTIAAKYITRVVSLSETSVGLRVILSANRPAAANFRLYYRTAIGDDNILVKSWNELSPQSTIASDENRSIFREYDYLLGGPGGNATSFDAFQLKIAMTTSNSSSVPIFKDLRAIALAV